MLARILFVCGPHCAGKSTILEALERSGRISFRGAEVGERLGLLLGASSVERGEDFDQEVTRLELMRDQVLTRRSGMVAGLETWHPGNLAYAFVRNPAAVDALLRRMRSSPLIEGARGIRLRLPAAEIRRRTTLFGDSPEWAVEFYSRLDEALGPSLDALGLRTRTVDVDASAGKAEVQREVLSFLAGLQPAACFCG